MENSSQELKSVHILLNPLTPLLASGKMVNTEVDTLLSLSTSKYDIFDCKSASSTLFISKMFHFESGTILP